MPINCIFDKDFYIYEIKKYSTHTVSWITTNWEEIFDEGIVPISTVPPTLLPQPVDIFFIDNIYKNFTIFNDNFPTPIERAQSFSIEGIFLLFFIDNFPTPIERLFSLDYNGIYSPFQNENYFPYAREEPFIFNLNYNNIFSYFKIKQGTFPYPSDWIEPFNLDNVYKIFENNYDNFHGFPAPRLKEWKEKVPPNTFHTTPKLIDTTLQIQTSSEKIINEETQTIHSQIISSNVLDRDAHREEYLTFVNNYWETKGQPMPENDED